MLYEVLHYEQSWSCCNAVFNNLFDIKKNSMGCKSREEKGGALYSISSGFSIYQYPCMWMSYA